MSPDQTAVEALLPCPFCGGADIILRDHDNGTPTVWMVCRGCGAQGPLSDWLGNAEAAWNTRVQPGGGAEDQSPLAPWKPCVERGVTCDGQWHRGWDGHDPYCQRCPRPKPDAEALAHDILGEFCACYAEAWPAETCAAEAKKLAERLVAPPSPVPEGFALVPVKSERDD